MSRPNEQYKFATHKECLHFNNGFCELKGITVTPERAACPNFATKRGIVSPQTAKSHLQLQSLLHNPSSLGQNFLAPPHFPQIHQRPPIPLVARVHVEQGYLRSQYAYKVPEQGVGVVFAMSSGRGTSRGRGGRSGSGGRRRGRMGQFAAGPGGFCICPSCGYTSPHTLGTPCYKQKCPKCGTFMTRKR